MLMRIRSEFPEQGRSPLLSMSAVWCARYVLYRARKVDIIHQNPITDFRVICSGMGIDFH